MVFTSMRAGVSTMQILGTSHWLRGRTGVELVRAANESPPNSGAGFVESLRAMSRWVGAISTD